MSWRVVRRTNGSGVTWGVVEISRCGWFQRISRGVPQPRATEFQNAWTACWGPTMVETVRPRVRARSANARASSTLACTGTRLAPTWQAATSSPSSKRPHTSPPSQRGSRVVVRARWSTKTFTTGSRPASAKKASRSGGPRGRTPWRVVSTRGAYAALGPTGSRSYSAARGDRVVRVDVVRVTIPVPSSRGGCPDRGRGCLEAARAAARPGHHHSRPRPADLAAARRGGRLRAGRRAVRRPRRGRTRRLRARAVHPRRHGPRRRGEDRPPPRGQGPARSPDRGPATDPARGPRGRPALRRLPGRPPADEGVHRRPDQGPRGGVRQPLPRDPGPSWLRRRRRGAGVLAGRHGRNRDPERPAVRHGETAPDLAPGLHGHDAPDADRHPQRDARDHRAERAGPVGRR